MKRLWCFLAAFSMLVGAMPVVGLGAEADSAAVTYLLRDVNAGGYAEVKMEDYQTYETEHFQIFWDTDGVNSAKVTDAFLQKGETVLEKCWDLYMDKMGMEPTSTSVLPNGDKVTQYKTNVILMGTGVEHYDLSGANDWGAYGSVDSAGYPYFMCCLAAMNSDTVVAHEFGHSTHYAQGDNAWQDNIYLGPWFEAVANWFAEQYIYEYMSSDTTQLSHLYLRESHLTKMNGRGYYEAWPILQYLTEDPDNTGVYGDGFMQKLLSTNLGSTNVLFWDVLEEANGDTLTTADTVGMFASHMATMDFEHKTLYNNTIKKFISNGLLYWQQRYTVLESLDGENLYAVPIERAPQAMAYNITPLEFTPGEITVKLNALTDAEGADWRGRLVIERNGETIYSDLFQAEEEMTVEAKDGDELYLSVAATPQLDTIVKHTIGGWATHSTEKNRPFETKTQYPYSVSLINCSPMMPPSNTYGTMKTHPNGGGRVATTATVASGAYVGENAMVTGYATVSDNAVVDGNAIVGGRAKVSGNAYVGDNAVVYGNAQITDKARVVENAFIYGNYKVGGYATVKGSSLSMAGGSAMGEAITYGDWFDDLGSIISMGSLSGYHSLSSNDNYASTRLYIPALRAKYDFENNARDSIAYSDLYVQGDVSIESTADFNGGYMTLNESVLCYDDIKLVTSVNGTGTVFTIGDEIKLEIDENEARLVTSEVEIVNANIKNGYNTVEVIFEDGITKLSVNKKTEEAQTSVAPVQAIRGGESYLGKGFNGSVDYLYIYDVNAEQEYSENTIEGSSLVADTKVFDCTGSSEYSELYKRMNGDWSIWYKWNTESTTVNVDGGLRIPDAQATTIKTPGYESNKFVIEFEPSGGKTYPDHGILDLDGSVLFSHRFAADANTIYVGRGETNDAIRGTVSINDTAGQKRLTNFVAEKLTSTSVREDRGALNYNSNTVRITVENYRWNEDLAEKFSAAENKTSLLSKMKSGEGIYLVTYSVVYGAIELPVSVSVYKGSMTGFGGFKTAGGTDGVDVCYGNLRVYVAKEPEITVENGSVTLENYEDEAICVFALYDGDVLTEVVTTPFTNNVAEIPQGFENAKIIIVNSFQELSPIASGISE